MDSPRHGEENRPPQLRIGYICTEFPSLSETFVYNEVRKLRERGLAIEVFSIHRPGREQLSLESRDLVEGTLYVLPLRAWDFVMVHLSLLASRPGRYLSLFLTFVVGKHLTDLTKMKRTFFHLLEAAYVAAESRKRGIAHHHAHFATGATSVAMFVAALNETTFSFTAHAMDIFRDKLLLKDKLRTASVVVTISEYNRQALSRECAGLSPEKIRIIRYGVDLAQFRRGNKAKEKEILLLSVGRLVEKKGFAYLISACKILRDRGHEFRCVIVGDGPERCGLETRIQELGLTGRVKLEGRVFHEAVKRYYEQAEVFVLPCLIAADGDRDGIPNVLIEAMAMELPCVSTTVSGIPELIEHMRDGLLVPPQNEVELAEALEALILDHRLRTVLGKSARAKVQAKFNLQHITDELEDLFVGLCRGLIQGKAVGN